MYTVSTIVYIVWFSSFFFFGCYFIFFRRQIDCETWNSCWMAAGSAIYVLDRFNARFINAYVYTNTVRREMHSACGQSCIGIEPCALKNVDVYCCIFYTSYEFVFVCRPFRDDIGGGLDVV